MLGSNEIQKLIHFCQKNKIAYLGVFGSVSRGEDGPSSDVDLLIKFEDKVSLLTISRIRREISDILSRPVDLVTESSLSPYLRKSIIDSTKVIYEQAG